jgi:hypothetical protein
LLAIKRAYLSPTALSANADCSSLLEGVSQSFVWTRSGDSLSFEKVEIENSSDPNRMILSGRLIYATRKFLLTRKLKVKIGMFIVERDTSINEDSECVNVKEATTRN